MRLKQLQELGIKEEVAKLMIEVIERYKDLNELEKQMLELTNAMKKTTDDLNKYLAEERNK